MEGPIGPPSPHVVVEEVGGDLVLFDRRARRYYELNATASAVWRLATGKRTLEDIVVAIAEAYGVAADAIRDEVSSVVGTFKEARLLADAPSASGPGE